MDVVGLLHPGEMGAAVGALLVARGHEVLWASEGRSEATATRARAAALTDAGTVAALARRSTIVLSVCPPHAALEIAGALASFDGVYVDANAIAPATAREVADLAGGAFVDGGIVGPPPRAPGDARLFLSGERAGMVAALFADSALEPVVVGAEPGLASAVKMTYAAWTKGTAALLLAVAQTARAYGVQDALDAEWERSQPSLPGRLASAERSAEAKGWRWIAEMQEIAATFEAVGQPGGFHASAAEVYRRAAAAQSSSS